MDADGKTFVSSIRSFGDFATLMVWVLRGEIDGVVRCKWDEMGLHLGCRLAITVCLYSASFINAQGYSGEKLGSFPGLYRDAGRFRPSTSVEKHDVCDASCAILDKSSSAVESFIEVMWINVIIDG